ncbi:glutaminase [Cnuella takakiae]|nr:glutaminase [Cnuella takakiae]
MSSGVIDAAIETAYLKYRGLKDGKNADYIPVLAEVNPELFGISMVTLDGKVYGKGDTSSRFSIQSISKVFTMARVIEEQGPKALMEKIGVDATGLKFNSIAAIELRKGKEINPLVNPGAIAATSMIGGATYDEKWNNILQTMSDFAGRELAVNEPVYKSEAATNQRNQAIAMLLSAYERLYFDPAQSTDIYTRQCAVNVDARDLAIMAATLANGGTNPVTGKRVVAAETVSHTLAVMATAGLYDDSGIWLFNVGLPGKSGVGGGIIAVAPGKFGIAAFSPRLDEAGNSVRAQKSITEVVNLLKANQFLVEPRAPKLAVSQVSQ